VSGFSLAWQPLISLILPGAAILAFGLEASHLINAGFEEDPPWKVADKRDINRPHRPRCPERAVLRATRTLDHADKELMLRDISSLVKD
jgi:hypothetical protein